jgi:hypothetical protein
LQVRTAPHAIAEPNLHAAARMLSVAPGYHSAKETEMVSAALAHPVIMLPLVATLPQALVLPMTPVQLMSLVARSKTTTPLQAPILLLRLRVPALAAAVSHLAVKPLWVLVITPLVQATARLVPLLPTALLQATLAMVLKAPLLPTALPQVTLAMALKAPLLLTVPLHPALVTLVLPLATVSLQALALLMVKAPAPLLPTV